jgi:hypothetical protein
LAISTFMIYIKLLDENVFVLRPTQGELIRDNVFKVLPTQNYDPEDEHWEFLPGTIVRCANRFSASLGKEILVAIEALASSVDSFS